MQAKPSPWPLAPNGKPARRVKAEQGIYWSISGKLEVCYTDSDGKVRFEPQASPNISAARARRRAILKAKDDGQTVRPNPNLKFGEVRALWLERKVAAKRPSTQHRYTWAAAKLPWHNRKIDKLTVADVEQVIRDLRAEGLSDATIHAIVTAAGQVFKFARSKLNWAGSNPVADLDSDDRPKPGSDSTRRLHSKDGLAATLRQAKPWAKAPLGFIAATAVRESEALAIQWHELHLDDETPYVEIAYQLSRGTKARPAERVALKTDGSASVVPLTREVVRLLKEHKLRSRHTAPEDYVFATTTGRPLSQRNLFRELDRAQRHAVDDYGDPVFPGAAYVGPDGKLVLCRREDGGLVNRGEAGLPHVHAMRHTLATNLVDAGVAVEEDMSKILRHKDSTTTARVYVHEIRSADALRRRADLLEKMASEWKVPTGTRRHRHPATGALMWLT